LLLGHRYYDPTLGRFLSRDPIKDGRNWYVYGHKQVTPEPHIPEDKDLGKILDAGAYELSETELLELNNARDEQAYGLSVVGIGVGVGLFVSPVGGIPIVITGGALNMGGSHKEEVLIATAIEEANEKTRKALANIRDGKLERPVAIPFTDITFRPKPPPPVYSEPNRYWWRDRELGMQQ
jgi:hypothetical protein